MIAIDTNIIVRYLTGEDREQTPRAVDIVDNQEVFVPITVLLELEWVLRKAYRFEPIKIVEAFRIFAGQPTVILEEADLVAEALELFAQGMDFADALHLLKAQHCEKFVTFDRKFIKAAQAAGYQSLQEA